MERAFEPAREFPEAAAKQCGAGAVEWFGSQLYGLSLPSPDTDFMAVLPSGGKIDLEDFLHSLAAMMRRPEAQKVGFTEVKIRAGEIDVSRRSSAERPLT